ncbi:Os11g0190700 [Oryza sativa Japonica Group]|uniref:Os11g0190700 protein n=1 Tax=Oryza sativa subsp. japonica TaxID=39947 RepID=Q0IU39_ORYSJ|nr:hypothetical protein DAI22_11g060501 [Oryza sativa Japonica Group]BAF27776.2 Os11g0190700 [Oryza sativa Japonica Group]|eukprot:NP_001067413.2 Os11g0190700 [Oryza sativa Japonica Group]
MRSSLAPRPCWWRTVSTSRCSRWTAPRRRPPTWRSFSSALITKQFGDALRAAADELVVRLDWSESMTHPNELWTNSNDECGPRCDEQAAFVGAFCGHAQLLEAALHHLVLPRRIPGDEAVQGAVHQPRRLW